MNPRSRFRPLAQVGLRARITLAFALGALAVSLLVIVTSTVLIRRTLLDQREQLVSERAGINAALVTGKVGPDDVDTQSVFGSLSTAGRPSVIVIDPSTGDPINISADTRYGAATLPEAMRRRVLEDRRASVMRYERNGEPLVAVGVPIDGRNAAYFEVNSLEDIESSLTSLRLPLITAAIVIGGLGAMLGWWASRRVLRPLAEISEVAADIAQGRLDARVAYSEWADDPDLAPLVSTFNDMVAALQDRIDRDARFASDVSHELRSPLTTFNATVEVLRNARDEMPERAQLALDLLGSDMERLTQLVEDLLEISRFDAGAVRLETDEVLLVPTVELAVRTLSPTPIEVIADSDLTDVIAVLDKRRLVRVLANYLDNAAKYGDGASAVRVERSPIDTAEANAPSDVGTRQGMIRIIVEDHGVGVPEAERGRVFDRFNRGSQGGSRGRDLGVGLGLALVAEHAALQGGSCWVEPRTDGQSGARFVVELPLIVPDDLAVGSRATGLDEVIVGPTEAEVIEVIES